MAIQGFTSVPQADGQDRYICNTCGGRDMNLNYLTRHVNSSVHQRNLLSIARGQNQASQSTLVGVLPGNAQNNFDVESDEGLNPNDLWYPFPAKECFSLDLKDIIAHEISNPYVNKHMEFYPHECYGKDIYALHQSAKWRECLSRETRVQMVEKANKHYYIFEPVTLKGPAQDIVIPIYFFKIKNSLYAKCIVPKLKDFPTTELKNGQPQIQLMIPQNIDYNSSNLFDIPVERFDLICSEMKWGDGTPFMDKIRHQLSCINVPNPWRHKAKGKIIRHVPITLYADDTSGNQSKRWNKHISYYFTLSGLPPVFSNMEYNIHFISTSNVAGALELGESIVNQLNQLATDGSCAYDCTLQQEVLFMTVPLCFLADSPMAAEITNTPIPGNCNNPCRICKLRVEAAEDRRGIVKYMVRDFMGKLTEDQRHEMEARLSSFNSDALHIHPIQAKYMLDHYKSFLGKDLRTIVQVAPFIFFPFMNQTELDIWISLCYICSMAFQTHIQDMDAYLAELESHIKIFMYNVVKMTAQWSKKPKFHMLLHLPASIKRFGPASLFATEKFESFNGVVRNAAIQINRHSPGHDIAIIFSNYQIEQLLVSGAHLYDSTVQEYFKPSDKVTDVFSRNPLIQQAMGYNSTALHESQYPRVKDTHVVQANLELVPEDIREMYPNQQVWQVSRKSPVPEPWEHIMCAINLGSELKVCIFCTGATVCGPGNSTRFQSNAVSICNTIALMENVKLKHPHASNANDKKVIQ
ncbi:uncharacterized protein PGTG_07627 [Puccinia graminis f. sp. tritici CRL 75-36-700-3]|uniref:C2H2-type domain-containing protein n=1 Tax=Puccinia graminis f. sp. tritici (strain CRL 75-36-700-3 / race SCCL) TaxID=418459 RepID=E3KCT4_PUCGT|nr:uncharacterized protein PGTG_07627 [Puccinia graminis f. sp. tritici CRL 75-36-700-3]EFP82230.1 hypothetical protein PGTG_07627 [Puccinia graminis f. sp. tritici CRL 75-36-700-3]